MLVYIQPLFTRLLISLLSIVIDRSTRFQNNGDLEGILKRAETKVSLIKYLSQVKLRAKVLIALPVRFVESIEV